MSPTAPFLPTAEEMGERTPAETTFLHFLSALRLFAAARAFPHVTGVFLIVVVPPTVPAQLSAAAACYYGKNYSFCRVAGYYILCPTGTPTFAAARRQRRDLIIANPVEANTPTVAGQAVAEASAPVNAGTVLLTDNDDRCTPPASTHRQIRTCPPRAKGPLDRRSKRLSFPHFFLRRKKCGRRRPPPRQGKTDSPPGRRNPPRAKGSLNRRSKWFSLVTFFLQKKKVTRAGARNAPSRARRRNTCLSPRQESLET